MRLILVLVAVFIVGIVIMAKNSRDELIKSDVNYMQANIKEFYAEKHTYPKSLSDLKTIMKIDEAELVEYSRWPYSYEITGDQSYDYYARLSFGGKFKGDSIQINKHLDAKVMVDVRQLLVPVGIFYEEKQRWPQNLDEAVDGIGIKQPVNPNTGKNYLYMIKDDNKSFVIVGILSDGTEYKYDSSL